MTLDEAIGHIKSCAKEMDARYGRTVFDEWAVISLAENKAQTSQKTSAPCARDCFTRIMARAILNLRGTAPAPALKRSWFWGGRFI